MMVRPIYLLASFHCECWDVDRDAWFITAGIIFVDEIDKICTPSNYRHGSDASSEGVQRDMLPIIEGCTVSTKHGNVNTNHMLFIASGAFHSVKPSDCKRAICRLTEPTVCK